MMGKVAREILKADVGYSRTCMLNIVLTALVDYNSWVESEQGLKLAASLDKDVVLAEGMRHNSFTTFSADRSTRLFPI